MEPLDTRQYFYSLSITNFALDHKGSRQYTAGRMDGPTQVVDVCFRGGWLWKYDCFLSVFQVFYEHRRRSQAV